MKLYILHSDLDETIEDFIIGAVPVISDDEGRLILVESSYKEVKESFPEIEDHVYYIAEY